MEMEEIIEILKENIDYSFLVKEQLKEREKIDLIINIMVEAIQGRTDIRINRRMTSFESIKEQFLSLQKEHINYILLVLGENKKKITNLRAYLLSLLYNAPVNILGMTSDTKLESTDYSKDREI